jgi:hypothetical protein
VNAVIVRFLLSVGAIPLPEKSYAPPQQKRKAFYVTSGVFLSPGMQVAGTERNSPNINGRYHSSRAWRNPAAEGLDTALHAGWPSTPNIHATSALSTPISVAAGTLLAHPSTRTSVDPLHVCRDHDPDAPNLGPTQGHPGGSIHLLLGRTDGDRLQHSDRLGAVADCRVNGSISCCDCLHSIVFHCASPFIKKTPTAGRKGRSIFHSILQFPKECKKEEEEKSLNPFGESKE